ncbi:MAG: RNA methyltransferase [Bacteroidota bacterium]
MVDLELLSYLETFISEGRKQRFLEILDQRTRFLTVAIEDVFQMHNTSAVLRSCEVFGVQDIHVVEDRFAKRLDKNIAMGAQQWVDVYSYGSSMDCVWELKRQGYQIVATTPYGDAQSLRDFTVTGKLALFFGTEKEGLSAGVMSSADVFLKIPMCGFTESLNISVSVAIILHNLTQKLRESNFGWALTPSEKLEKQLDWTKKSIKSIDEILRRYRGSQ